MRMIAFVMLVKFSLIEADFSLFDGGALNLSRNISKTIVEGEDEEKKERGNRMIFLNFLHNFDFLLVFK